MDDLKKIQLMEYMFTRLKKDREFAKELGIDIFPIRDVWVKYKLVQINLKLQEQLVPLLAVLDELLIGEEDNVTEKVNKVKELIEKSKEVKTYEEYTEYLKNIEIKHYTDGRVIIIL